MSQPSSVPMFNPGDLLEDIDTDPFIHRPSANQWLGHNANHHDGQSTLAPGGNKVQDGALKLLGTHSQLGRGNRANPLGAQDG